LIGAFWFQACPLKKMAELVIKYLTRLSTLKLTDIQIEHNLNFLCAKNAPVVDASVSDKVQSAPYLNSQI
jgi:hypothetical protein